jgi:diaminopimelate decarboxylase
VVVGHCCESGDLLTPAPGEPETISERELALAEPGDILVVEGRWEEHAVLRTCRRR